MSYLQKDINSIGISVTELSSSLKAKYKTDEGAFLQVLTDILGF